MKKFFGFFMIALFLSACGYRPATQYTKEVLGTNIFVDVSISRHDPKNSVFMKDALNEAVITRFGARLSDETSADSKLYLSIGTITFSPTSYDVDGYVISYKAVVNLNITYTQKNGNKNSISTSGEFDFPISANSVISDSKRFEAIKLSSIDALNEFVSKVSIENIKKDK